MANALYLLKAFHLNQKKLGLFCKAQLALLVLVILSSPVCAQVSIKDQIIPLGDEYQNSIQILDNRFRIDSGVKEVTLIFFRDYGTAPIVLVRPDGSKLFLENAISDPSYDWYETSSYDMIALRNPMPGPWQALGDILPESRVMVIADITLMASPIPSTVFSGESLKQTARLRNGDQIVDMSAFRDVVSLSIDFVSTNNPNYPNFGLGSRSIARFEDNGQGLDERSADGVFTGKFELNIPEGEWRPTFTVRTPLFSREQIGKNVILKPNPIIVNHEIDINEQGDHLLKLDVDRNYIDIESLLLDGAIRQPNGETIRFSVTESGPEVKMIEVMNTGYGIYRINITAFATTNDGRDIVLRVPEYSFVTEAPIIEDNLDDTIDGEIDTTENSIAEISNSNDEELIAPEELISSLSEPEGMSIVMLAIIVNASILLIGSILIVSVMHIRNRPNDHIFKSVNLALIKRMPNAMLQSLFSMFAKLKPKKKEKAET